MQDDIVRKYAEPADVHELVSSSAVVLAMVFLVMEPSLVHQLLALDRALKQSVLRLFPDLARSDSNPKHVRWPINTQRRVWNAGQLYPEAFRRDRHGPRSFKNSAASVNGGRASSIPGHCLGPRLTKLSR